MKTYAENRKAFFNYQILEEYEAGIVLTGAEVKSVRSGHISLREAFVTPRAGELYLTNAHIAAYKPAADSDPEPTRSRKLLLKKAEIEKLITKSQAKGNTMVPLSAYPKGPNIKIKFALVRGKKKYDKRETIKKREQEIEMKRGLKEGH